MKPQGKDSLQFEHLKICKYLNGKEIGGLDFL